MFTPDVITFESLSRTFNVRFAAGSAASQVTEPLVGTSHSGPKKLKPFSFEFTLVL